MLRGGGGEEFGGREGKGDQGGEEEKWYGLGGGWGEKEGWSDWDKGNTPTYLFTDVVSSDADEIEDDIHIPGVVNSVLLR